MSRTSAHHEARRYRPTPTRRQKDSPGAVLLVAGPNIGTELLRRHCIAVLSAGRDLELLRLGPGTANERYLLQALARWYGRAHVQAVQSHSDWVALPRDRIITVLSDRGFWCGDEQVADTKTMRTMAHSALVEIYGSRR